ncbi:MAG: hydantoinase/oxoprolinase family protein [Pirellula sp.]
MNSNEEFDSAQDSALSSQGIECSTSPTVKPNAAPWIGVDIGGANLKAAHSSGWSKSISFPMWKQPETLAVGIAQLLEEAPAFVGVGVTMTGELADCFATRSEGVLHILEQTTLILPASMVRIYGVDGQWRTPSAAARVPWTVAASNWHALARVVGATYPKGMSLLVDIGSTTTDLIPIVDGNIAIEASTDSQRLQCGALVYTGIERSNVAAIVQRVPLYGSLCPVMNEYFAASRDVHIWLGDMPENDSDCDTSDGQPANRLGARHRIARVVGEDGSTLADEDIDAIASCVRREQASLIARAMQQVCTMSRSAKGKSKSSKLASQRPGSIPGECLTPDRIIVCGHGSFLLEDALQIATWNIPKLEWSKMLGEGLSRCAPAYAIAVLAQEQLDYLA